MSFSKPIFGLEINTTISLLNIICIMNHDQFHRIFSGENTDRLLELLSEILDLSKIHNTPQNQSNTQQFIPSVLRASIIKTYGYLI